MDSYTKPKPRRARGLGMRRCNSCGKRFRVPYSGAVLCTSCGAIAASRATRRSAK